MVQIGSSLGILDNAANRASTCALDSVGKVYCWGHNGYGQLGNASNNNSFLPVAVSDAGVLANKVLTQLSVGDLHVCALDTQGQAYCWGRNNYGQLGNGSTNDSNTPVAVDASGVLAGKTLTQIQSGETSTCALDSSGQAYCWGRNKIGRAHV